MILDLCVFALTAGITYALMSEGLWGAALQFFNVLFASLIAFNFYEPVAQLIVDNVGSETVSSFADSVSMMLLFIVALLLLRLATESLSPSMVRFPTPVYHIGRVVFGLGGAVIMMAMLLLGFQASPVQKKMLGTWDYNHKPILGGERFDRDYLAFFQYTTGYTFARNGKGDPDPAREFPSKPLLFDPRGEWLLVHQLARPYGTEPILAPEAGAEGAAAPAAGAGGGAAPGGPGGPAGPGMPGAGKPGPGIPGGTAGAAAGLAPTTP
jgi:uncharacterized membrane protein required for colicin V production